MCVSSLGLLLRQLSLTRYLPSRHAVPRLIGFITWTVGVAVCTAGCGLSTSAAATPAIVVDTATGDVLYAEQATEPWYPASLTKLMTFYVAMEAVRDHKLSLDTPIVISARAARAAPSKMGFRPGTELTLRNALKMMVVKSANDLAVAVAEAVDGSVEAFADDMNREAAKLGMRESHFVNPNGLPDPDHVSSARDLAIVARAIDLDFPHAATWFGIGALRVGDRVIPNLNSLLGRYPGVDGMKTGFTCAAGFNLVTTAERNGRRYLTVVLGAPTPKLRALKTAVLLDRAFDGIDHPQENLMALAGGGPGVAADAGNDVCRRRGHSIAAFEAETKDLEAPLLALKTMPAPIAAGMAFFTGGARLGQILTPVAPTLASIPKPVFDPQTAFVGPEPDYQGPVAAERPPNSPLGTPLPVTARSEVAAPTETTKTAEIKKSHKRVRIVRRHIRHAEKIAGKTKPHHHVAKAEARKKETIDDKRRTEKIAEEHRHTKREHRIRQAKNVTAKKHRTSHTADAPVQLEGGKAAGSGGQ